MKQRFFTVPNILSCLRLVLVSVFIVLYFEGKKSLAFSAMVVSCVSDSLDGWIARKFNQVTDIGKVLDPIADKLFTVSTVLCLCIGGVLPWWFVTVLALKETLMLIGGSIFMRKTDKIIPSRWYGKITTAFIFMTLVYAMVLDAAGMFDELNPLNVTISALSSVRTGLLVLCIIGSALAVFSFVMYTKMAVGIYKNTKSRIGEE